MSSRHKDMILHLEYIAFLTKEIFLFIYSYFNQSVLMSYAFFADLTDYLVIFCLDVTFPRTRQYVLSFHNVAYLHTIFRVFISFHLQGSESFVPWVLALYPWLIFYWWIGQILFAGFKTYTHFSSFFKFLYYRHVLLSTASSS